MTERPVTSESLLRGVRNNLHLLSKYYFFQIEQCVENVWIEALDKNT